MRYLIAPLLEKIKNSYNLQNESDRAKTEYRHNDNDYSTAALVYYYLMRQKPYNT
jgi:hypothetical protein